MMKEVTTKVMNMPGMRVNQGATPRRMSQTVQTMRVLAARIWLPQAKYFQSHSKLSALRLLHQSRAATMAMRGRQRPRRATKRRWGTRVISARVRRRERRAVSPLVMARTMTERTVTVPIQEPRKVRVLSMRAWVAGLAMSSGKRL